MSSFIIGKEVFEVQASALKFAGSRLSKSFDEAVEMILETEGRVVVSGMGKSGIIGNKIAATFASTGTPSHSVHPAEAYHGDLGMFAKNDLVVLISYSGETEEVIRLIPSLRHLGVKVIALVGNLFSTLSRNSDLVLDVSVEREACPNNLAPTTSTTVALAMGDALAVALIEKRGFKSQDFALYHPGGSLGRRLLTRVKDVMKREIPICNPGEKFADVIMAITCGGLGLAVVVYDKRLMGVITDGDLRRALASRKTFEELNASQIMSSNPLAVSEEDMFSDAENIMLDNDVTSLVVIGETGEVSGVVKLQDAKVFK